MYQQIKKHDASHTFVIILGVALIYFLLGWLGLFLVIPGTNVSTVWPAAGFGLAAVLLLGFRSAVGIVIGSSLINLFQLNEITPEFSPLFNYVHILISVINGLGASLQAIVGAFFIHLFLPGLNILNKPLNVAKFLFLAALSCLINSNIGTMTFLSAGYLPWSYYGSFWLAWFLGDLGGVFTVTPLIIAWLYTAPVLFSWKEVLEALSLLALLIFSTVVILFATGWHTYLYYPCLVWAAARFDFKGATLMLAIVIAVISYATINSIGVFGHYPFGMTLINIEVLFIVATITTLMLTAELHQRRTIRTLWHGSPKTFPKYTTRILEYFWKVKK